jgi:hypothetical protein
MNLILSCLKFICTSEDETVWFPETSVNKWSVTFSRDREKTEVYHIHKKGKFTLEQATKAHRMIRCKPYSFFNLCARWRWVVNALPRPLYPRERPCTLYPFYRRLGGGRSGGVVWRSVENLAPTGIRSPDRPARSESLYRLRYPGSSTTSIPLRT